MFTSAFDWTSSSAVSRWPSKTREHQSAVPVAFLTLIYARFLANQKGTMSLWPSCDAGMRDVRPSLSCASIVSRRSASKRTTAMCPRSEARIRAVIPLVCFMVTSPLSRLGCAPSPHDLHSTHERVNPSACVMFTLTPRSMRKRNFHVPFLACFDE